MKNPFKKFTIALTGEFGPGRSHEKMKDWIEANGGTFGRQINNDVTHLVCSLKDWKKRPKIGQWTDPLLQTPLPFCRRAWRLQGVATDFHA